MFDSYLGYVTHRRKLGFCIFAIRNAIHLSILELGDFLLKKVKVLVRKVII